MTAIQDKNQAPVYEQGKCPFTTCKLEFPHTVFHCRAVREGRWRVFDSISDDGQIWFRDNEPGDPMPGPREAFAIPAGDQA